MVLPARWKLCIFSTHLRIERFVADAEYFVDQQNIGVDADGHRKSQAQTHPARIGSQRLVDELADARKLDDLLEALVHLAAGQSHQRGVDANIFGSGEIGMKPGAEFEQRGDFSVHAEWSRDPAARDRWRDSAACSCRIRWGR